MEIWHDFVRSVIIFSVDNRSSSHSYNQNNNILVLGEEPNQSINDSIGSAEKKLVLTLVKQRQNFALVYITMVLRVIYV